VTMGIAAHGPNAGLAVFKGLRAAERVGTGSIGGFATFAAITADGRLLRADTQRGGTRTLFLDGETTGIEPPPDIATATSAAVISSGPERPELEKLLTADAAAGLVTGHRMPITIGVDGIPINQQTLDFLKQGMSAKEAVDAVLDRNPEIDAGLIAIDGKGRLYARNSARVLRRPDLAEGRSERDGASVAVFYNAIRPLSVLAGLVTEIALDTMLGVPQPDGQITVNAGIPLIAGDETAIHCDANGVATHMTTNETMRLTGHQICTGIYLGSPVYMEGKLIGHTMLEAMTTFHDGRLVSMSGQTSVPYGFRAVAR
jgi:Domain of unknown function (DUF6963)